MSEISSILSVLPKLPGFVSVAQEVGGRYIFDYGTFHLGRDVIMWVKLLRSAQHPTLQPMLLEVGDWSRGLLWENHGEGLCKDLTTRLAWAGDQPVITIVEKRWNGDVVYVRPFEELLVTNLNLGGLKGFHLKVEAAGFLGLDYVTSVNEDRLLQEQAEAQAALTLQQQRAEADSARLVAKQERVSAIMARPRLIVYGPRSVECCGTPVLALEWPSLENGTPVVVVDSYEPATETSEAVIGNPSEFFRVRKLKGKNPQKANRVEHVHCTKSEAAATSVTSITPTLPKQLGYVVVLFSNGVTTSVPQFASAADAAAHRAAGNIKMVWYAVGQDKNRTLYQIVDSEVKTLGKDKYKFTDEEALGKAA